MADCLAGTAPNAVQDAAAAPTPAAPAAKPTRVSEETLATLRQLDCPTVFNAVHQLTPKHGAADEEYWRANTVLDPATQYTDGTIKCMERPIAPETAVVGYAVTTEVTTNEPDSAIGIEWNEYYDWLISNPGPHVAVMKDVDSMFPRLRSAVFGDGMATLHKRCGTVGAVCDGVIRDLDGIKRVGFPIWGTGEVSGHGRFVVKAFKVPVTVGQLRVNHGDLIMADSGGVVRIPIEIADKVAERAMNIRGKEVAIFEYFRSDGFKPLDMGTKCGELSDAYDKEHPESF